MPNAFFFFWFLIFGGVGGVVYLNIRDIIIKDNVRVTNYFTTFFTNNKYNKWLLVSKKSNINDRIRWKQVRIR